MREHLPNRRQSENFELIFSGIPVAVTLGRDSSDRVAEVSLTTSKAGSPADIACRDTAILTSLCLQHGCDAGTMERALTKDATGRPEDFVGVVAERLRINGFDTFAAKVATHHASHLPRQHMSGKV